MAIFDFELGCVQKHKFRHIDTTTWIGKLVPISVSISSEFIEQPNFFAIRILQRWLTLLLMLLIV